MASKIIQPKNESLNTAIYVDYDNIFELLKRYEADPLKINLLPTIFNKLKNEYNFNIVECIAFANFEKKPFQGRHRTALHNYGVDTRHAASNGKNCGDLMLTVDAITALYKKSTIDVFVIISSDRDLVPLMKAIRCENKLTYLLSTRYGFNNLVTFYADSHAYLEDIFNLTPDMLQNEKETLEFFVIGNEFKDSDIEKARKVSELLYSSNIWQTCEKEGNPLTLKGYVSIVSHKLGEDISRIELYFKLAHTMKYITMYKDKNKGLCIKKGDNYLAALGIHEI